MTAAKKTEKEIVIRTAAGEKSITPPEFGTVTLQFSNGQLMYIDRNEREKIS